MRITSIGPLSIHQTTGIEITALSQDHEGTGYDVWPFWRPRRLDLTLRITRPTRNEALAVVDQLAASIYNNETKRFAMSGNASFGLAVWGESRLGNVYTWFVHADMRLLSIEQSADGVVARVQVRGMVLYPPSTPISQSPIIEMTTMHAFAVTPTSFVGGDDGTLYACILTITTPDTTGIRDSVIVIESRASSAEVAQTRYIQPTSASSNCVVETLPSGGTRYRVQSGSSATVTYSVANNALPSVPLMIYACVHVPTGVTGTVSVSWPGQSTVVSTVTDGRTWYPITIDHLGHRAHTITMQLSTIATNTYIFPLLAVPVDGAQMWYVSGAGKYDVLTLYISERSYVASSLVTNAPGAVIYGPPFPITRKWLSITHGLALPDMHTATSNVTLIGCMTVPSAWM